MIITIDDVNKMMFCLLLFLVVLSSIGFFKLGELSSFNNIRNSMMKTLDEKFECFYLNESVGGLYYTKRINSLGNTYPIINQ